MCFIFICAQQRNKEGNNDTNQRFKSITRYNDPVLNDGAYVFVSLKDQSVLGTGDYFKGSAQGARVEGLYKDYGGDGGGKSESGGLPRTSRPRLDKPSRFVADDTNI
ncbi:hypothetical protein A4G16_07385 [Mannheimia granulomatis]|uniref:Uncharacterized protein n=1 Tax=Mannheimia granulomatis TaxID=85402 RepID=A0A6G8JJB8_9PAST|nr:hypothetical protein A4G16_07385 [Mannheimia granulomatis]